MILRARILCVWVAGRMLADQKFMTVFSMLFGAGIVLMTGRAEARGESGRLHYRRMGWLLGIGLLHGHLLWSGDILFLYAVCGLVVYPLRRQPPGRLLALGTVLVGVASAVLVITGLSLPYWSGEERAEFLTEVWQPTPAMIDAELGAYRGEWLDQQPVRSEAAFGFETLVLLTWGMWRAGGLMLIGMALFAQGVFSARQSFRFYATLILLAIAIGLPVQGYGIALDFERGWSAWSFFLGVQFNYWGSLRSQSGLCRRGHVGVPKAGASALHASVRIRRADRSDQLPAPDRHLHDDLLRSRSRVVRLGGPCWAGRSGGKRLGGATHRLVALASPLPLRAGRVGVAVTYLRHSPATAKEAQALARAENAIAPDRQVASMRRVRAFLITAAPSLP